MGKVKEGKMIRDEIIQEALLAEYENPYMYNEDISPAENASRSIASKKQVGGRHYMAYKIQPLDIIDEYKLNFYLGNALKYILRKKDNHVMDIDKAIHYLELYKERALNVK